jgi:hypothetical protein
VTFRAHRAANARSFYTVRRSRRDDAVRVTAVTADGRVPVATRRYRTCGGSLIGTIPLF